MDKIQKEAKAAQLVDSYGAHGLAMMLIETEEKLEAGQGRIEHLEDRSRKDAEMINNLIVGNQAAWIAWNVSGDAEEGMKRIVNGLWPPGLLPDDSEPWVNDPDLYFAANRSNPFPQCHCGKPSIQLWMGNGACCDEHMAEVKKKAMANQEASR